MSKMAGPGGREVGRVSIRVLPDTSSFARSLERYLERMERSSRVDIPVSLNQGDVAKSAAQLDALTRDRKTEIKVDVDRSSIDRLGKLLGGATGGVGGALGGLSKGIPMKGLGILAAVVAAVPVLAGLIASLPGMLAGIATPIAAIALGFEGIKKAARVLSGPLKQLQAVVSGVFERGLTPIFEKLVGLFPTLERGFSAVADSLILMFDSVVDQIMSPRGMGQIASVFDSIAGGFAKLAPAMKPLVDALMTLADQGAQAFERWAPKIAGFIGGFDKLIRQMEANGDLARAFDALGGIISAAILLFGAFVIYGLQGLALMDRTAGRIKAVAQAVGGFVAGMASRIRAIFSALGNFIGNVTDRSWGSVLRQIAKYGGAIIVAVARMRTGVLLQFLGMSTGAVGVARALPGRVGGALSALVGRARSVAANAASALVNALRNGMSTAVAVIRTLPSRAAGAVGDLSRVLFNAGASLISGFVSGMLSKLSAVASAAASIASKVKGHFPGSPVKEGPLVSWNNGGAGKRLAEMLAGGLVAGVPSVAAAANRLASSVGSADPFTVSGIGGAGGGRPIIVNDKSGDPVRTAREVVRREAFAGAA